MSQAARRHSATGSTPSAMPLKISESHPKSDNTEWFYEYNINHSNFILLSDIPAHPYILIARQIPHDIDVVVLEWEILSSSDIKVHLPLYHVVSAKRALPAMRTSISRFITILQNRR